MPTPGGDEERLPWLEPYRDSPGDKPHVAARSDKRGAGLMIGGIAGIAAALTAGYYIGQRDQAPPAPPTAIAEAPVKQTPAAPTPAMPAPTPPPAPAPAPAAAPPIAKTAPPVKAEPAPARNKYAARSAKKPVRRAVRQRQIRNAAGERARYRQVRAAQQRATRQASLPVVHRNYRSWPKMPSPGPAGQVVQLGAFRTEGRALAAYRVRLARYPVLGSMPRVVVPVITKPSGQVLYVLRLGTTSRQQSRVVCRNLRASGDHCIVIG